MIDLSKRKGGHTNLNLVPFVDLFSTLILFLMATAVFDQLASVPVNMGTNDASTNKVDEGHVNGKKITSTVLASINETEIILSDSGKQTKIPLAQAQQDEYKEVADFMQNARRQHEDLREIVIDSTDKAKYNDIVAVMDQALALNFDQLVVTGEDKK